MRSTKPIRSGDGSRSLPLVTAVPERRGRLSIYAKSRVRCEWFRPQPPSTLAAPISCRPPRWVQTSPSKTSRHTCLPPRSRLWMSSSGGPTRRWRRKPLKLHSAAPRTCWRRSAGHLRPSGRGDGGSLMHRPLAHRALVGCPTITEIPMYDQSKLSELIRFARVDAGSTVIDVYPGDGDWTRLFSEVVGLEGRVYGFVPAEVADFKNDPVGRMRTLAKEPGRENVEAVSADLVAMREAPRPADGRGLPLCCHDPPAER